MSRLDFAALRDNLAGSGIALGRVSDSWHVVEGAVATIKIDQDLPLSEEEAVLAMFREASDASRQAVRVATELFEGVLAPLGLVELLAKNASVSSPILTLKSLPSHDAAELRNAGLTDIEILDFFDAGLANFASLAAEASKYGATATLLGSLAKAEAAINHMTAMGIDEWRSDLIEGHSFWKKVLGAVQVVAGAVVVGGDLVIAAAAETAAAAATAPAGGAGAAIAAPEVYAGMAVSCGAGVGLAATGGKEFVD